ncbi:AAA family ATPase [Candidatus Poriferisocius sp.]|uniref:AAA family ATPase n=1 Tax=Candidatus Poriferisocius sp. TaxID=3101276 RepID=UPI003B025756
MATADQVKALIRSHAAGDDYQFYAVALQMAAREARNGHAGYAQDLRELIDAAKGRSAKAVPTPMVAPRGDLASLLSVEYPEQRLSDLSLDKDVLSALRRVLHEQRQRDRLRAAGFAPLRRLLLVGPPGTGKTLTARVLAGELRLPLFTVRLEGLITKFMGETAAKLRLIFDQLAETAGAYLFDEVDALAGARTNSNDVGEIRRVLNSFLQFLEQDASNSVIIATSNLPEHLDRALYRRFDVMLNYPMPSGEIAKQVIRNRLAMFDLGTVCWQQVSSIAKGLSHSEITAAAEQAAKEAILIDQEKVGTKLLVEALQARQVSVISPSE